MSEVRATHEVQIDDGVIRVTKWSFAPGAATGWHRHAYDYVVVPLTTGKLKIVSASGEAVSALQAGRSYARQAGVEHDVVNANDFDFTFVEVELLDRPG